MLRTLWNRLSRPARLPSTRPRGEVKLALRDVQHRYRNDVEALKSVSMEVHAGEFVCLLGPSGCGKSTLLYALAGHVTPSAGTLLVDGNAIHGPSPDRLLMFQEASLFPWLTVKQNLTFPLRAKGLSRAAADIRALDYLHQVALDGFERALPHELSGGMRMRVSLARALAMDPAVLLMDEPFAPLDAQTRANMHGLLQSVWLRSRKTVVFVTHNIRESLVLGDRVVVMAGRPGRVLYELQVDLPRPRDADDPRLVHLERQILEVLKRAQAATQSRGPRTGSEADGGELGSETADSTQLAATELRLRASRPLGSGR